MLKIHLFLETLTNLNTGKITAAMQRNNIVNLKKKLGGGTNLTQEQSFKQGLSTPTSTSSSQSNMHSLNSSKKNLKLSK